MYGSKRVAHNHDICIFLSILHVEMLLKVTYSAYKRKYYDSLLHFYYDIRRNPKNKNG